MTTLNESGKSPIANLDYWKSYLEESSLQIPLYLSGKGDGSIYKTIKLQLDPKLRKGTEQFASSNNYSITSLFTALCATLVLRYADQDNIVLFSSVPAVPLKVTISKETGITEFITSLVSQFDEGEKRPLPDIDKLIDLLGSGFKANVQSGLVAIREATDQSAPQQFEPYDIIF